MATNEITALVLSADAPPDVAVPDWRNLPAEQLLDIGDQLNDLNRRTQLALGAWITVYADERGYGAITDLAERWGRSPQTLRNWKSVYNRTRSILHEVRLLEFGKAQQLARVPEEAQADWLPTANALSRGDLGSAINKAKKANDWRPPVIIAPENRAGAQPKRKSRRPEPDVARGSPTAPEVVQDSQNGNTGAHAANPARISPNESDITPESAPETCSEPITREKLQNPSSDQPKGRRLPLGPLGVIYWFTPAQDEELRREATD